MEYLSIYAPKAVSVLSIGVPVKAKSAIVNYRIATPETELVKTQMRQGIELP